MLVINDSVYGVRETCVCVCLCVCVWSESIFQIKKGIKTSSSLENVQSTQENSLQGFPDSSVIKNPPEGDSCLIPDPGRPHVPRSI